LQYDDQVLGRVKSMLSQGYTPTLDHFRILPVEGRKLRSCKPGLVRRKGDAVQLVVPQSLRRQLFTHTHAGRTFSLAKNVGALTPPLLLARHA